MAKQSILGRISQLMKANIDSILDQADDPQLMLDHLLRDYRHSIADAEAAVAQTIGNVRLMEQDHTHDRNAAADWGRTALAASEKADKLRADGNVGEADTCDNLAKIAIGRQVSSENEARALSPTIAAQTLIVEQLTQGIDGMKQKLSELTSKRDEADVLGQQHSAASRLDADVDSGDELAKQSDIAARLAALKAGGTRADS
ncbi:MAG: PspA/IM30 family protein [Rhodoglobus sp.]